MTSHSPAVALPVNAQRLPWRAELVAVLEWNVLHFTKFVANWPALGSAIEVLPMSHTPSGRNRPCPCQSGEKFKQCCAPEVLLAPITSEVRNRARESVFLWGVKNFRDDWEIASGELVERVEGNSEAFGPLQRSALALGLENLFCFQLPLDSATRVGDLWLRAHPKAPKAVRRYVKLALRSCLLPYEVIEVNPGVGLELRGLLDPSDVVKVSERSGSRSCKPGDVICARVIETGPLGQPMLEGDLFHIPFLAVDSLLKNLNYQIETIPPRVLEAPLSTALMDAACDAAEIVLQLFTYVIENPVVPKMVSSSGETYRFTTLRYHVNDWQTVCDFFDSSCEEISRRGPRNPDRLELRWRASSEPKEGSRISLNGGFGPPPDFLLHSGKLWVYAVHASPIEHLRNPLERALGGAILFETEQSEENPSPAAMQDFVDGMSRVAEDDSLAPHDEIPPEAQAVLMQEVKSRHYRTWPDTCLPLLDGLTPRKAAQLPLWRPKVEALVNSFIGDYLREMDEGNHLAYDPSWMLEELELVGEPDPAHPPELAHVRWAKMISGWGQAVSDLCGLDPLATAGVRRAALSEEQYTNLSAHLSVRRLLKMQDASDAAPADADDLVQSLECVSRYQHGLRKTFWIAPSLAVQLEQTSCEIHRKDLKLPFQSFALVMTDRVVLGLCERLLAKNYPGHALVGHLIKVTTVYVSEVDHQGERRLDIVIAPDTLGADAPKVIAYSHDLTADEPFPSGEPDAGDSNVAVTHGNDDEDVLIIPKTDPSNDLLRIILNAILYCTHPKEALPCGSSQEKPHASAQAQKPIKVASDQQETERILFLPGFLTLTQTRQLRKLRDTAKGTQLFSRHMVRGHWRRVVSSTGSVKLSWVRPHWRGQSIGVILEKAWRVT